MWRILDFKRRSICDRVAIRGTDMFLFGSSKEDKKPAMRGEDCSQMKRDVDGMDRFLQQVIDGDYTARAPQAHSPEMQRLGRKME